MFIPTEHHKNSSLDLDAFRDIKKTKPEDQQRGVCRSMCFFFFWEGNRCKALGTHAMVFVKK